MRKVLLPVLLLFFLQVTAQNFTPGNLVIYRAGTGSAALSSVSTAVFLDEYSPAGTLVQTIVLPTAVAGSNYPLSASGTATSEGLLNRSADGYYLLATGYAAAPGVAAIAGTSSATTPRVVGFIDYAKTINTTTALTDFSSANNPRSAVSSDGTTVWVAGGAGGVRYTTKGSTTSTQLSTTVTNLREVNIFSNQLYVSTSSGSSVRIGTVGSGLPTSSGQTITNLPGFPVSGSPYQFILFDLDAGVAGNDVLYVADDAAGVQKFSLVSGNWVLNGTIGTGADAYRGLTGSVSGSTATLYATRKGTELVSITDATGYNAAPSATPGLLATASTNTAFRGIAFAPVAPVNNLSLAFSAVSSSSPLMPPAVTTTLSDATDPLAVTGVSVDVKDNGVSILATDYTLTAASSNTTVVPNANITITKADGQATIKLTAAAAGYADITLTLTKGSFTKTLVLNVAASSASATPSATKYHSGTSDASAAIAIDDNYMIVADDEMNKLFVYNRTSSGLPVTSFDFSTLLSLTDLSGGVPREVDVEAGVRSKNVANRIYWLGSMSNSATSFNARPNRNRLFAVTSNGTGSSTSFSYVGMYTNLKQDLVTWGDANGYAFSTGAAAGKDPKAIDGFNVEGLSFAPDNTTAYIGFRAPLVPTANRTKAVIAPVLNFEAWFNNGSPAGSPSIGSPIELDLGTRGIRDLVRLSNGTYVILAGNYDDGPLNPAIYTWTGNAVSSPVLQNSFTVSSLNPEAVMEIQSAGNIQTDKLQVLSDNGDVVYYGDGIAAKDLTQNNFKKFRSDILISGSGGVLPVTLNFFDVQKANNTALVKWAIESSANIDRFIIERSTDANSFSVVGTVTAAQGRKNYNWNDALVVTGRLYYRLAIIDVNGKKTYSAIRNITTEEKESLVIYPNPVTDGLVSIVTKDNDAKYAILFDATGKKIQEWNFTSATLDISLRNMVSGTYYIAVSNKQKIIGTKTIVVK